VEKRVLSELRPQKRLACLWLVDLRGCLHPRQGSGKALEKSSALFQERDHFAHSTTRTEIIAQFVESKEETKEEVLDKAKQPEVQPMDWPLNCISLRP
jgi:hypothetical protein